ncbi:MAG: L-threonylcarbamoyladenylate synthase [Planctomycetota bacterium]
MPAVVIDLKQAEDLRDVVHRTVEALSAGKVVAVPTETVYGLIASALHPSAVERVFEIKGRSPDKPLAIATKSLEDAMDYVPDMSSLARRIARRSWPGPITIVHSAQHPDSVIHRLDNVVKAATIPSGKIGMRVPAHELTLQIMRLCAGPIVMTSANRSGGPNPQNAEQVVQSIGDSTDIVLDDGPCDVGTPSSVIEVNGNQVHVLRQGGVDPAALQRLTNFIGLIVCTGNTCRSPMGEAIFQELVAKRLGCATDELPQRGIQIISAGIAAMPGATATQQAVDVMRRHGIEIADHSSQPMTGRMGQFADLILTMTNGHRRAIIEHWPMFEPRTKTLRRDGGDISDPIGSPFEVYDACANQIRENLEAWVDEIDWSQFENQNPDS